MSRAFLTIALKELRDILSSRYFIVLCAALIVAVTLSLLVASLDFHNRLDDYNRYVEALRQSGATPAEAPPSLSVLQQLRGSFEYIEIIGAVLAIVIGYGLLAKEKYRGTLRLLFSRPLGTFDVAVGKITALAIIWLIAVASMQVVIIAMLRLVGGASLSSGELVKVSLSMAEGWAYMMIWSSLALGLTALIRQPGISLATCFILWLTVVLIIPQIGDTMDPDNQVPGGLFKSLQVEKSREQDVMAHFTGYEDIRNFLEESSISKHFERASFAFLGVKEIYNQKPVALIWGDTWKDTGWLAAGLSITTLLSLTQVNKRNLTGKEIT